jgi:hypothetical protein
MSYRFNPPPGWPPVPPGWSPPAGWQPDPSWPPPPPGWQLWVTESESNAPEPLATAPQGDTRVWAIRPIGGGSRQPEREPARAARSLKGTWESTWARFRRLPMWAKILLVVLILALLPFLLVVGGLSAAAIGGTALFRGPLPRFGITRRATAGLVLVLGLISVFVGSAMAAAVFSPTAPTQSLQPTVAVPTSAPVTAAVPTTSPPVPGTTQPPTTRPPTIHPSKAPVTTRPPRPSTRPPAPPPALTVAIVSLPPTGQGSLATATAHTAPGANCTIDVEYKSGTSTAAGLYPKTASPSGAVSWTWMVGTRTTPGDWPVTVTCTRGDAVESDEQLLTVLDTGKPG